MASGTWSARAWCSSPVACVTAVIAFGVLLYLNWSLTLITLSVMGAFGVGMALAFRGFGRSSASADRSRPRSPGGSPKTLGGIRIVKAYTAERRERLTFARGAHRLFRNIATAVTGTSGVTAFTTLVLGVVGVIMTLIGGRAILEGRMTLGDFVMYVFFTGLVAAPLINIASIGTQITEAFAGLDRIRELLQ